MTERQSLPELLAELQVTAERLKALQSAAEFKTLVEAAQRKPQLRAPTLPQPRTAAEPKAPAAEDKPAEYHTELMDLLHQAIAHFNIGPDRWPKHNELVAFFLARGVSGNVAKVMATICRPPAAQHGGNKRAPKPSRPKGLTS